MDSKGIRNDNNPTGNIPSRGNTQLRIVDAGQEVVLRGYGSHDAKALADLLRVENWREIAAEEQRRRATRIIEALDEATLSDIANGKIDMAVACQTVLEELRATSKLRPGR